MLTWEPCLINRCALCSRSAFPIPKNTRTLFRTLAPHPLARRRLDGILRHSFETMRMLVSSPYIALLLLRSQVQHSEVAMLIGYAARKLTFVDVLKTELPS